MMVQLLAAPGLVQEEMPQMVMVMKMVKGMILVVME